MGPSELLLELARCLCGREELTNHGTACLEQEGQGQEAQEPEGVLAQEKLRSWFGGGNGRGSCLNGVLSTPLRENCR